jgi:hypothetical protein
MKTTVYENGLPKIVSVSTETYHSTYSRVTVICEDNSVWVKQYTYVDDAISLPWVKIG